MASIRMVTRDAELMASMRETGAVLIGKTALVEHGLSAMGLNTRSGTPRNPYNPSHLTGGSSSGSAAAVSAGLCPFALGARLRPYLRPLCMYAASAGCSLEVVVYCSMASGFTGSLCGPLQLHNPSRLPTRAVHCRHRRRRQRAHPGILLRAGGPDAHVWARRGAHCIQPALLPHRGRDRAAGRLRRRRAAAVRGLRQRRCGAPRPARAMVCYAADQLDNLASHILPYGVAVPCSAILFRGDAGGCTPSASRM